jgi:hypothetical protein
MSARIVDRHGEPYETRAVRQRMGFLPGELGESGETVAWDKPGHFEIVELRSTSNGDNDEALMKAKR